jgi:hypothetical protein
MHGPTLRRSEEVLPSPLERQARPCAPPDPHLGGASEPTSLRSVGPGALGQYDGGASVSTDGEAVTNAARVPRVSSEPGLASGASTRVSNQVTHGRDSTESAAADTATSVSPPRPVGLLRIARRFAVLAILSLLATLPGLAVGTDAGPPRFRRT